jgi:hypothetical protein
MTVAEVNLWERTIGAVSLAEPANNRAAEGFAECVV